MISCKEFYNLNLDKLKTNIINEHIHPCLTIIHTDSEDTGYKLYIKGIESACKYVGINVFHAELKFNKRTEVCYLSHENDLIETIHYPFIINNLYNDIIQKYYCSTLLLSKWDIDCIKTNSQFEPAIIRGIFEFLEYNGCNLTGKNVCVIGRSKNIGKYIAEKVNQLNGTVTLCHSYTPLLDIGKYVYYADYVFATANKSHFIDSYNITPNTVVIDVGATDLVDNKFKGVIDTTRERNFKERAQKENIFLTPINNGVGLLTRIGLLQNCIDAYRRK